MTVIITNLFEIVSFVFRATLWIFPWFLISILLATLVNSLKLDGAIKKAFDNRVGVAILAATVVGAFSPFCSCTVIPIVAGLLSSGVPLAPVMAFWIASPSMDPEIYPMTVALLGFDLANIRLTATLALSLAAGFGTLFLSHSGFFADIQIIPQKKEKYSATKNSCCEEGITAAAAVAVTNVGYSSESLSRPASPIPVLAIAGGTSVPFNPQGQFNNSTSLDSSCSIPISSAELAKTTWQARITDSFREIDWNQFTSDALKDGWRLGKWILLAFVLEALITRFVPQEVIASTIGGGAWWAVPLAAGIGVPLYLSNLTALPIVSGLLAQGMQPGAAIAFLIAGPVTTIPAMTAVYGIVHRRVFFLYLFFGMVGAVLLGYITNLIA